ncbi:uncharacterized protein LOC128681894 isoform X2 [Plodia interpunctella]|uniref:uncharacterized protein LOC128681894 isoform X2 n=1 Tax=Plodia interpunctella TaxID=58824 RepID=UPI002368A8E8|nr:uncharacterized protein LOC128681894 isoform X2 [Plodia interpunctella]
MSEIWNLSAICRCCHSDGHFKSLSRSYVVNNDVEIYSSMLRDTFGIIINAPAGDISFAICDLCINSLRRATQFKKQVLICEAKFEEYCKNEEAQQIQDDIKIEMSSIDGDDYELDRDDFHNGFEDTKCEIIPSEVKTEEKKLVKKEDIKQEDDDEEKKTTSVRQKKSKNNGEEKERKRLAGRRRMENIRKNPDKYALWEVKMKEMYLKRK